LTSRHQTGPGKARGFLQPFDGILSDRSSACAGARATISMVRRRMSIVQTGMVAPSGVVTRGIRSWAITRYLAIFLVLNGFVLSGILGWAPPEPYKGTVLNPTWDVLQGRGCADSWGIMATSLRYAQTPHKHNTPLYSEIFFNRHLKFQYPPSSLFA